MNGSDASPSPRAGGDLVARNSGEPNRAQFGNRGAASQPAGLSLAYDALYRITNMVDGAGQTK